MVWQDNHYPKNVKKQKNTPFYPKKPLFTLKKQKNTPFYPKKTKKHPFLPFL